MSTFSNLLKAKKITKCKNPTSNVKPTDSKPVIKHSVDTTSKLERPVPVPSISSTHQELPQFVSSLTSFHKLYSSISSSVATECTLLQSIVYRYNRQQRHADFYNMLRIVSRRVRHMYSQLLLVDTVVQDLSSPNTELQALIANAPLGKKHGQTGSRMSSSILHTPSSLAMYLSFAGVEDEISDTAHSLQQMLASVVTAIPKFTAQIVATYFIPLCMTCYAALTRIYLLARSLLRVIIPVWRSLAALRAPDAAPEASGTDTAAAIEVILRLKVDVSLLFPAVHDRSPSALSQGFAEAFLAPLDAPAAPVLLQFLQKPSEQAPTLRSPVEATPVSTPPPNPLLAGFHRAHRSRPHRPALQPVGGFSSSGTVTGASMSAPASTGPALGVDGCLIAEESSDSEADADEPMRSRAVLADDVSKDRTAVAADVRTVGETHTVTKSGSSDTLKNTAAVASQGGASGKAKPSADSLRKKLKSRRDRDEAPPQSPAPKKAKLDQAGTHKNSLQSNSNTVMPGGDVKSTGAGVPAAKASTFPKASSSTSNLDTFLGSRPAASATNASGAKAKKKKKSQAALDDIFGSI
jgi:hypothetical protein